MTEKEKLRMVLTETIKCAWCGKGNEISVKEKIIKPAEAAVKERKIVVERSTQTTLDKIGKR